MFKYNFLINKETCFVHWIRLMLFYHWPHIAIKWEKSNIFKQSKYYFDFVGEFNKQELSALEKLKDILNKNERKFTEQWFWDRYLNKEIIDEEIIKIWNNIQKELSSKFEKIWETEYPKLLKWQEILNNYDYSKFNIVIFKIIKFLKSENFKNEIDVYLNIFFSKTGLHAEQKVSENLILLNISNLDFKYVSRLFSILIHEITHYLFDYSNKEKLLKDVFLKINNSNKTKLSYWKLKKIKFKKFLSKILSPKKIRIVPLPWNYLINESIVSSVAGQGINYINKNLFPENISEKEIKMFSNVKYEDNKNNYSIQIKFVANKLFPITEEYLNNEKEMDDLYCEKVVHTWFDFRGVKIDDKICYRQATTAFIANNQINDFIVSHVNFPLMYVVEVFKRLGKTSLESLPILKNKAIYIPLNEREDEFFHKKEVELETKFVVDDIAIILNKLSKFSHFVKHEYIRDTIYNLDDSRLRLRIKNDFEKISVEAMFKHRVAGGNGVKIEVEETVYTGNSIEDAIKKIMSIGKFIEYNSYEKIRINYEIDEYKAHLTLDIYPYGVWLEIEASEDAIWQIAKLFGFKKNQAIEKNADELYEDWCQKNNSDVLWDVRFGFPNLKDNIYREAGSNEINLRE